jgi:carbon monoxide dehydrogenase subunit G
MKLAGEYRFDATVQDVWDALFDPAVLAAAMPGCEKLERVDGQFVGEMKIKIGPVSGAFSGKVELVDVEEPSRYRMLIDGRGNAGFVKATATMELAADGEGTRLRYAGDAQVGGKIASVGERLIDASSRAIVKQSLDNLHENVKIRAAAAAAKAAAVAAKTPEAAPPEPQPEPELKRAQASDFAAGVAREVTRSLAPWLVAGAVVIAIAAWLLLR